MDADAEKRIEQAANAARRARETAEFLGDLKKDDAIVKPIVNPEAFVMRTKLRGAAERGELSRPGCRHPLGSIRQFVDDDPSVKRSGKPVNLFECGVCEMILWFVDPWGDPVGDA